MLWHSGAPTPHGRREKHAREKGCLNPVCSQTEFLPYPDNYFKLILMVDAFHHLYNQKLTAMEMWRVLAPEGRIIVEEPNINYFQITQIPF